MIWASDYGRLEIVEKLIKHGAKVNYQKKDGWCAFIAACLNLRENVIKVLLLKYNVDTSMKCVGKTGI